MTGMELKILDWLQTIRTPIGDALMCFITSLGNVGAIWIVLAVVLIAIPKTRKSGIIVAAALIIDAVLCSGILKNVFRRIRPFDVNIAVQVLITKPRDFSFPSGHISIFCSSYRVVFGKRAKTVCHNISVSLSDRLFENVSVCTLSNRYPWWSSFGYYIGLSCLLVSEENPGSTQKQ